MDKAFDRSQELPDALLARLFAALEQMRTLLGSASREESAAARGADIHSVRARHRFEKAMGDLLAMERPMSRPLRQKTYHCIDLVLQNFAAVSGSELPGIGAAAAEIKVILSEAKSCWDDPEPDARTAVAEANDLAARTVMRWSVRGRNTVDIAPPRNIGSLVPQKQQPAEVEAPPLSSLTDSESLTSGPILAQL
jgi:hypothetical protein